MYMICFFVPKVCQIREEAALNDKHNIKVMSKSYQGHLKVKLAENSYNVHFLSISTLLLCSHLLQRTALTYPSSYMYFLHTF